MSNPAPGVVAAVLAGGRGRRMGGEGGGAGAAIVKGLLVVENQRIIDRQLAVLRPRFAEVIIAANDPEPWAGLGLRVVADRVAGGIGPIAGLDAVLAALPDQVGAVVCVASDMPFLAAPLLDRLRDGAPGAAALVPRLGGRAEPLLARYARTIAPVVAEQIAAGRHALVDLLARLGVTWIDEPELRALDPQLRSIANVNTRADLARLDPKQGT
jgi:molybdopterin-guanine dinucleotide biosynthesis protein A